MARQVFDTCAEYPGAVSVTATDGHLYHTYLQKVLTDYTGRHVDTNVYNSPQERGAADYLYEWDIPLTVKTPVTNWRVQSTVANVFKELHRCFNCNLPGPGAPATYPSTGQLLQLWDVFGFVQAPVRAYPHDSEGYLLSIAQPGHFDGAGSTVEFTFQRVGDGSMNLHVTAQSPTTRRCSSSARAARPPAGTSSPNSWAQPGQPPRGNPHLLSTGRHTRQSAPTTCHTGPAPRHGGAGPACSPVSFVRPCLLDWPPIVQSRAKQLPGQETGPTTEITPGSGP